MSNSPQMASKKNKIKTAQSYKNTNRQNETERQHKNRLGYTHSF